MGGVPPPCCSAHDLSLTPTGDVHRTGSVRIDDGDAEAETPGGKSWNSPLAVVFAFTLLYRRKQVPFSSFLSLCETFNLFSEVARKISFSQTDSKLTERETPWLVVYFSPSIQ
jgi:hypothetical protein